MISSLEVATFEYLLNHRSCREAYRENKSVSKLNFEDLKYLTKILSSRSSIVLFNLPGRMNYLLCHDGIA